MVKCMKFFDRISETLGLYEEDEEILEEEEVVKKAEEAPKRIPRSTPAASRAAAPVEPITPVKSEPAAEKKSFFSKKNVQDSPEAKPSPCRLLKSRSK